MTRETKIGLLVGLAFIIVIGILLSDHLTSSTEPPQAALANAGSNVRQAVASPGQIAPQLAPITAPTSTGPNAPVPTRDELTPGPNPTAIVKVGPAGNSQTPRVTTTPQQGAANRQTEQPQQVASTDPPITRESATQVNPQPNTLNDVAHQQGEELVLVDQNGHAIKGTLASRTSVAEYKAESGDTLSKMAAKMMGSSNKTNQDAIVAVNPSLKTDRNKVIVGRTYKIPTSPQTSAAALSNEKSSAQTDAPAPAPAKVAEKSTDDSVYEVKAGDSLWKIASEQCGSAKAVAALKELNKDVLAGPEHDQVLVGTKLRLPAPSVAQAR